MDHIGSLGTEHIIERRMRLWQARRKAAGERPKAEPDGGIRFITLTHGEGTLGDEIAAQLADRLGWHVFDKEIVNYIAEHSHVREDLVRQLDERSQGLMHETIMRLLRMTEWGSFGCDEYYEALLKSLAFLAAQGQCVLVGRGSNFVLRAEKHGLHIRTFASPEVRAERLGLCWHVAPELARRCMLAGDEARRNFVRHHFKHDIDDLRFYDQVINTDHLSVKQAVESIMKLMDAAPDLSSVKIAPGQGNSERAVSN